MVCEVNNVISLYLLGDSAAGALKMRNKLASQQHEVYPFVDDLRFGPMEGLEDGSKQRLSWWTNVWQAQW